MNSPDIQVGIPRGEGGKKKEERECSEYIYIYIYIV
jgi:hypothetical protein